jgi:flagellar hook-basal body complex protein FliE
MNNLTVGATPFTPLKPALHQPQTQKAETPSFSQVIKDAVSTVDNMGKQADTAIVEMLQGNGDVPETMIQLQKFDISMQVLMSMRNKAVEAYKEISRMQF